MVNQPPLHLQHKFLQQVASSVIFSVSIWVESDWGFLPAAWIHFPAEYKTKHLHLGLSFAWGARCKHNTGGYNFTLREGKHYFPSCFPFCVAVFNP